MHISFHVLLVISISRYRISLHTVQFSHIKLDQFLVTKPRHHGHRLIFFSYFHLFVIKVYKSLSLSKWNEVAIVLKTMMSSQSHLWRKHWKLNQELWWYGQSLRGGQRGREEGKEELWSRVINRPLLFPISPFWLGWMYRSPVEVWLPLLGCWCYAAIRYWW